MIPESLLLSFFKNATSRLMQLKGDEAMQEMDCCHNDAIVDPISASRRYVLTVQETIVNESVDQYNNSNNDENVVSAMLLRECLGRLGNNSFSSPEVEVAMEGMNEAARLVLCKLVLYWEWSIARTTTIEEKSATQRYLQDSPTEQGLDRTRLLEYFGLCQAALKLHTVKKYMIDGGHLFEDLPSQKSTKDNDTQLMFPHTRLEHVQQLLAKSVGWDPVFLTKELQRVFVERDETLALVHDAEVNTVFQELVQHMQIAIQTASLQMQQKQQVKLLSDLEKGGNTRVVSVQYSEFEMTPDGQKLSTEGQMATSTDAPGASVMEESHTQQQQLSEEEQKRQIRLASEASMLQQEILGELLRLPEHERNNRLQEAEVVSQKFMQEVIALPPGPDRLAFLQSVDPTTSRQLAMHKLWNGMLQANGGKLPKLAAKCDH